MTDPATYGYDPPDGFDTHIERRIHFDVANRVTAKIFVENSIAARKLVANNHLSGLRRSPDFSDDFRRCSEVPSYLADDQLSIIRWVGDVRHGRCR
jgi:hypothetical protein